MYKRILSLILCFCLVLTSCSSNKLDTNQVSKNNIKIGENFELLALNSDGQGIDSATKFQLTSKENVDKKYVKDNLEIVPSQDYEIEEVSSKVYNIIPLSKLENDKVYQVKLNDDQYAYSWAFQTKKKLDIDSTIPSDNSTYVPLNTSIEMYFTLDNLGKIDEYFDIEPKVDGKFIEVGNLITFVPNSLEVNTNYTVTIKKGFGLKDSTQKLEEDYIFSFKTESGEYAKLYFNSPLINIYEDNIKIVDAFVNEKYKENEFDINIYQYKNVDDFSKELNYFVQTGKFVENIAVKNNLVKINTLKQKPYIKERSYMTNALFELPDEAYFAVFPKSINTLVDLYPYIWDNGLRKEYLSNIDLGVEDASAEKGGGGGEDGAFRDDFKDTNIFETITTDKNGEASMKFKLADNLTSWRITYQAVSDKLYAGSGSKNITASLPFYVDLIMGKEYLKEDKICASLRVFGTDTKKSDEVDYKLVVRNKETSEELEYSQIGVIGENTNIYLDKLDEGQYEIYVYANCKNLKDGIKEEFNVVNSSVFFNNTHKYELNDDTVLDKVYSNPIITLFNESKSGFYNSLYDISSSSGSRIDQTVCSMVATKYINEYFKSDLYYNEEQLLQQINNYEAVDGGFKLLPYVDANVELSAKLINTIDNDYINAKTKIYFKDVLKNNSEYTTDVSAALWGLSKFKEPILLTIYDLLENDVLEKKDKICLSLALIELGDINLAKKFYEEIIADNLKESGDYLYYENNKSELDNYEITALVSILGVKLYDFDKSDKLFKYIYNNPSKYTLSNFEQLIYIMNRDIINLDEIKNLFGEVSITIDGVNTNYKLKLFDTESFAVTKDKIQDVKFKNIKGDIACKVEALGNKDDLDKNKSDDLSIQVAYSPKNSSTEQIDYKQSDVVKVTITPSFSSNIERGYYEVTYIIPSGFRFMDVDRTNTAWFDENGQKIKFNLYYDKENYATNPLVFYIQASQMGEYTVDYVVIKDCMEDKLNYLEKAKLNVY